MEASSSTAKVRLPAGVSVTAARETASTDAQGVVVQGMQFSIRLPGGATTSVFVPYSELHDTAEVQKIIDARVNAILAVTT